MLLHAPRQASPTKPPAGSQHLPIRPLRVRLHPRFILSVSFIARDPKHLGTPPFLTATPRAAFQPHRHPRHTTYHPHDADNSLSPLPTEWQQLLRHRPLLIRLRKLLPTPRCRSRHRHRLRRRLPSPPLPHLFLPRLRPFCLGPAFTIRVHRCVAVRSFFPHKAKRSALACQVNQETKPWTSRHGDI